MSNSELTMVYLLGGIIALIILINVIGVLFPPKKNRPPKRKTTPLAAHKPIAPLHHTELSAAPKPVAPVTAALDAELCKKYPLVDTAYKNGYRFVSYNPLVMELRE